jgi:23S rRNA (adenine2503-C2)-methyltransferase
MDACHYYTAKRGRRIFFEWAMISGENDSEGHAHSLGKLLKELDAHVNLIPLNPTKGYEGSPSPRDSVVKFQTTLAIYGVPSTVRQRRGIDINAGCGQLRARVSNSQNFETNIAS